MGAVLEQVRIREIGGQSFLVGRAADDGSENNWQKGQTVWVAVGDVAQMTEFADLQQYKLAAASVRR